MIPVPRTHRQNILQNWAKGEHQKAWANRDDCRQTKMLIPEVTKKRLEGGEKLVQEKHQNCHTIAHWTCNSKKTSKHHEIGGRSNMQSV